MTRRLGPWLSALVLVSLVLAVAPRAGAQFSPGALSKAHADLEGTLACVKCHELGVGKGPSDARCLECHKVLRERITAGKGFHSRGERNKGCAKCHSEHNGRDYDLLGLDRKAFDHGETGYPLAGKHTGLECEKCHKEKKGFLGLSSDCVSCHEDQHKGQLARECQRCHDESAWKPASGFKHDDARYPLTGAHVPVACAKCHPGGKYKDVRFDDCIACHASPHAADFVAGKTCSSCHETGAWTGGKAASEFDHSRTRFPLDGGHVKVACASCHKGGRYKELAGAACVTCHQDPHQGQFQAGHPGGCVSCHVTASWKPAPRFDHAASRYPLAGGHVQAKCQACHAKGKYTGTTTVCRECHRDPHRGELGLDCERCHDPASWAQAGFDHATSRFPLVGRHAEANCHACHGRGPEAHHAKLDVSCAACHTDPHRAQFRERYAAAPPAPGTAAPPPASPADSVAFAAAGGPPPVTSRTDCAACHGPAAWKPSSYDHARGRFPLEAGHAQVPCAKCHKEGVYAGTPTACLSCHADPHQAQFTRQACPDCHVAVKWNQVHFDHHGTSFPLTGSHATVACSSCHQEGRFHALSPRCVDCHEDAHLRALGGQCERCHETTGWVPSTFAHGVEVFPAWGAHQAVDCAACHRDEVTWQVDVPPSECLDCHDADFRRAPVVVHLQAGPDCERCHGFDNWRGAHDDAWFNIRTGQHHGIACLTCHPQAPADYLEHTCRACHSDGRGE